MNRINLLSYLLLLLSAITLVATVYFLSNIKVLENWKLSIPNTEIHVGDTVTIESTYNKLRDTSGESTRYITCKNKAGLWVRYELNRATSDRAKGKGGTGIVVIIRRDIADVPTQCKFEVAIRYEVLPFRSVHVVNETNTFTLYPEKVTESSSNESLTATQTSQSPTAPPSRSNSSVSYPNNTPPAQQLPSNSSQQSDNPAPEPSPPTPQQPSLINRVLNPVTNILDGIL